MSRLEKAAGDLDAALGALETAQIAYTRGGSVDRVNAAKRKVEDAECNYRFVSGGNVYPNRNR